MFHDKYDNNHIAHNSATTYVTGHKNTTSTKYMGRNINRQCIATKKENSTLKVVHEWGCVHTKQNSKNYEEPRSNQSTKTEIESLPLYRIFTN